MDGETPPAKRGRGRPRKITTGEAPKVSKPPTPSTTPGEKRGRGRPRKTPADPQEQSTPLPKQPVGRPRRSDANGESSSKRPVGRPRRSDANEESPAKRPRGRPRLSDANEESAAKRPRGRPRRSDANEESAAKPLSDGNEESPVKRKRGRPRKSDAAPAANQATESAAEPPSKVPDKSSAASDVFSLDKLVGSYKIECEEVKSNWPERAEDMGITIEKQLTETSGLIASFNLGILEGKMMLAADEESLTALRNRMDEGSNKDLTEDALQRDCERDNEAAESAGKGSNRKLLLVWQGRDNGDTNEVHPFRGDRSVGHIEFLDDEALRFDGEIAAPALGEACKFSGSRTEWDEYHVEGTWADYDQSAYEKANADRWG